MYILRLEVKQHVSDLYGHHQVFFFPLKVWLYKLCEKGCDLEISPWRKGGWLPADTPRMNPRPPTDINRVSQEERTKLRESVPCVKLYRYNPKHLYTKLNGYGDNGQRSLKLWQLLQTYWLPNSYWNWQEYVVSVMLISVLNIKLTCEWHKAIKLNYENTRTHVTVVLRVTKHCTYRQ